MDRVRVMFRKLLYINFLMKFSNWIYMVAHYKELPLHVIPFKLFILIFIHTIYPIHYPILKSWCSVVWIPTVSKWNEYLHLYICYWVTENVVNEFSSHSLWGSLTKFISNNCHNHFHYDVLLRNLPNSICNTCSVINHCNICTTHNTISVYKIVNLIYIVTNPLQVT